MSTVRRGPFAVDLDKYCAISLGGSRSPRRRLALWLLDSDFHCVASFRFAQFAREKFGESRILGLPLLLVSGVWRRRVATIHHTVIDRTARIGPGFYLMHRTGIFVGPVTIGANCVLHHNVTIGQRVAAGNQAVPRLGDNVWVGPGAVLTGDIEIGDNVTISAGTVLSKSVPAGSLVAGNPGRVVQADYDNRSILGYVVADAEQGRALPLRSA